MKLLYESNETVHTKVLWKLSCLMTGSYPQGLEGPYGVTSQRDAWLPLSPHVVSLWTSPAVRETLTTVGENSQASLPFSLVGVRLLVISSSPSWV